MCIAISLCNPKWRQSPIFRRQRKHKCTYNTQFLPIALLESFIHSLADANYLFCIGPHQWLRTCQDWQEKQRGNRVLVKLRTLLGDYHGGWIEKYDEYISKGKWLPAFHSQTEKRFGLPGWNCYILEERKNTFRTSATYVHVFTQYWNQH